MPTRADWIVQVPGRPTLWPTPRPDKAILKTFPAWAGKDEPIHLQDSIPCDDLLAKDQALYIPPSLATNHLKPTLAFQLYWQPYVPHAYTPRLRLWDTMDKKAVEVLPPYLYQHEGRKCASCDFGKTTAECVHVYWTAFDPRTQAYPALDGNANEMEISIEGGCWPCIVKGRVCNLVGTIIDGPKNSKRIPRASIEESKKSLHQMFGIPARYDIYDSNVHGPKLDSTAPTASGISAPETASNSSAHTRCRTTTRPASILPRTSDEAAQIVSSIAQTTTAPPNPMKQYCHISFKDHTRVLSNSHSNQLSSSETANETVANSSISQSLSHALNVPPSFGRGKRQQHESSTMSPKKQKFDLEQVMTRVISRLSDAGEREKDRPHSTCRISLTLPSAPLSPPTTASSSDGRKMITTDSSLLNVETLSRRNMSKNDDFASPLVDGNRRDEADNLRKSDEDRIMEGLERRVDMLKREKEALILENSRLKEREMKYLKNQEKLKSDNISEMETAEKEKQDALSRLRLEQEKVRMLSNLLIAAKAEIDQEFLRMLDITKESASRGPLL